MLWQKDANGIFVNICRKDLDERKFERLNDLLGKPAQKAKCNLYSTQCRKKGNSFFAQEQWYHAIKAYNVSLCFAENGSEEMSLAYANRSACSFYLRVYEKSLADIELARQRKLPKRYLAKLLEREALCWEEIERNDRTPAYSEPELSFEADDRYNCMANVLEIRQNEQFGRHLSAKSYIGVGKILIKEEPVLASFSGQYKRCETCWKSEIVLIPCANCTSSLFCAAGPCRESPIHKIQCGMRVIKSDLVNNHQMQLIRSVLMAIYEFSSVHDLMNFVEAAIAGDPTEIPASLNDAKSKYRACLQLLKDRQICATEAFSTQLLFVYKTLMDHPEIVSKFPSTKHAHFLMHLIAHHMGTIQWNTGALAYDPEAEFNVTQDLSENLSILANYINHSCAPNVCLISTNNLNLCVTLRPIKAGDQLFVSYFRNDHVEHNTLDRQTYLRDICEFNCRCERCVPPSMVPKGLLEEMRSDECYLYIRENVRLWHRRRQLDSPDLLFCTCFLYKTTDHNAEMMKAKCCAFLNKFGHLCWTPEMDYVVKCYENVLRESHLLQ